MLVVNERTLDLTRKEAWLTNSISIEHCIIWKSFLHDPPFLTHSISPRYFPS